MNDSCEAAVLTEHPLQEAADHSQCSEVSFQDNRQSIWWITDKGRKVRSSRAGGLALHLAWVRCSISGTRIQDHRSPVRMSAMGSLVFCTDCGNLLDSSSGNSNAK